MFHIHVTPTARLVSCRLEQVVLSQSIPRSAPLSLRKVCLSSFQRSSSSSSAFLNFSGNKRLHTSTAAVCSNASPSWPSLPSIPSTALRHHHHRPFSHSRKSFATFAVPMSELSANQHVVATYNVLSSSLCEPDYYSHCDPANLLPANRLEKLKALLSNEMDQGTILCLQEVSELWAAQLHALFQANGYHFVHRLYGSPFNGYMGVGIAFPNARYELEDADIVRVSNTRKWPRAPLPSDAPWAVASRAVVGALKGTTRLLLRKKPAKPPIVPVEYAKRRFNALVSVRLAMRDGNGSAPNLVVATYHMPCAFFAPPVMNMHVALCARRAIEFAKDDALVLCGDFNIKPHEPGYRILTEGCMSDDENAEHAAACEKSGIADDWAPALDKSLGGAFRSAYVEQLGLEPDFTNYAMNFKDTGPFIDTLDYILVRDGMSLKSTESGGMVATGVKTRMEVTDVRALPHRKEVTDGPYPNDTELSDHAMLKANLTIT